ncbi:SIRT5 [Ramazzottius varieornatus]|uniref:NAD-dependent protein deacylase n=1 Tax=Ramazzottius varieornatus TaxID=947166 RepID=A0A1D1VUZ1_RAMVA|nr:SIRT5 [Ramazzottius varieornatus]
MKLRIFVTSLRTFAGPGYRPPLLTSMALHNDLSHRRRLLSAWATDRVRQQESFQAELIKARRIVVLTGAGVSAESGIPTFRGAGGFWGKYSATELATYGAFVRDPSLVWTFYEYRRATVLQTKPNPGHVALAETEAVLENNEKKLTIVTQNIDGLHQRAGSKNVIEIHGSLFKTECTKCRKVEENLQVPICDALKDARMPDADNEQLKIPEEQLPRCGSCGGLLRPHVVWFGENLDEEVLKRVYQELGSCDLCLVVGTSSVVYPAAMFAPHVAARSVSVAEFNMELTGGADASNYLFLGPSGKTLPEALAPLLKALQKAENLVF